MLSAFGSGSNGFTYSRDLIYSGPACGTWGFMKKRKIMKISGFICELYKKILSLYQT